MHRRDFLGTLGLAALPWPGLGAAEAGPSEPAWSAWKAAFLEPSGRVVDDLQDRVSHSEGQGYGAVLAVAHGDRPALDAIVAWTEAHLAVRQDPLLAWRWEPEPGDRVRDYNNATDGDLFYAWALLRAARRFRDAGHLARRAEELAAAIARICVVPDPRGGGRSVLLPAAESFGRTGTVVFNPSYVMPLALQALAGAFGLPALARAAEDGADLIAEIAEAGLVPDWVRLDADGWKPDPDRAPVSGFEAVRVPLYLIWSGRFGHPAVRRAPAGSGDGLPLVRDLRDGRTIEATTKAGFAALADLAAAAARPGAGPLTPFVAEQSYYAATLHLLALVAAAETGLAGARN